MKKLTTLLALLLAVTAQAAPLSDADKAEFVPKNILVNPGAENLTQGWTATGGTFTTTSTLANVRAGKRAFSWDSSAAAQIVSSPLSLINGLAGSNGSAQCRIKVPSGVATHKLQVHDGTNVIAEQSIASTSSYVSTAVTFIFPSSGSVRLRLVSVAANEPLIYVDECQLGENQLVQVGQASIAGVASFMPTLTCQWGVVSVTPAAFGAVVACPGPTIEESSLGDWQTTDTDLPRWTVNNLPPGKYEAIVTGQILGSGTGDFAQFSISDGTTVSGSGNGSAVGGGSYDAQMTSIGVFTYTSAGNRTFELYGSSASGSALVGIDATKLRLVLKRYPLVSEAAVRMDTVNWKVDANIATTDSSDFSLGTAVQTSYVTPGNPNAALTQNTGSALAFITCENAEVASGTTCVTESEEPGVSFTVPAAGDIEACVEFAFDMQGAGSDATFQIVETPNGAHTISQEGKSRIQTAGGAGVVSPLNLCGTFSFASSGQKTLRLAFEKSATGSSPLVKASALAANGSFDIHWTVRPLTQQVPAPILVGSVVTPSTGVTNIVYAHVSDGAGLECTTGVCGIDRQSGGITSVTHSGVAGDYAVVFAPGTFSAAPSCTCSDDFVGNRVCSPQVVTSSGIGNLFFTTGATASQVDARFNLVCVGPK